MSEETQLQPDFSRYREVISYARFSSARQSLGTSEERQHDAVAAFAQEHGLVLSSRSSTDRGLSGYHGRNLKVGALGALIQQLRERLIPVPCLLLVERQDRFGRRPTTQTLLTLFGDLFGLGCDLYHLNQRRLYSTEIVDQDFGALVTLAAEIHSAHHYSAVLSQRMTVAFAKTRERIARGEPVRPGLAPSWITWTGTAWELTDYSTTIRRLLQLLREGSGFQATATTLNGEGRRSPKGKPWCAASVYQVFRSPSLAGGRLLDRSAGTAQWDYYPALIDREEWEALKAAISRRVPSYAPPSARDTCYWIGQGLTFCPECGVAQGRHTSDLKRNGQRVTWEYLRCRNSTNGQCKEPAIHLRAVAAHVLTRLQPSQLALVLSGSSEGASEAITLRIEQLTRERDAAQGAIEGATEQMAALMANGEAATAAVMARAMPGLEERLASLQEQLDAAVAELQGIDLRDEITALSEPLLALQRSFANGTDTAEQRRAVNAAMRRLGLRIEVRTKSQEVGLSVAGGPLQWQHVTPIDTAALWDGVAGWNEGRGDGLLVEPDPMQTELKDS